MITTLENLTEKVQENNLKNLAKNIVKYQNFKTSAFIHKIDKIGFSEKTIKTYVDCGISYIKNNKKSININKKLYQYIQEYIDQHLQPLTPSFNEKRVCLQKKNAVLPVQKVLNKIQEKAKPTILTKIAVKINNTIIIQDSVNEANGFIKGIKFIDKNLNASIINISYEEI